MADETRRRGGRDHDGEARSHSGARWPWAVGAVGLLVVAGFLLGQPTPDGSDAAAADEVTVVPLAAPALPPTSGHEVFVATDGLPTNPGTKAAPVDLATALSSNTPAAPGDVIWLRGGSYVGNFRGALNGTEAAPIQVRQFAGERATIAAASVETPALAIEGSWTWYRDFEVAIAEPARRNPAPDALDLRAAGAVLVAGSHIAVVNLVIHDLPRGIAVMPGAVGTVIAGNLVYHSGWKNDTRAMGIQLTAGTNRDRYILENIVFGQGGPGISVSLSKGDRLLMEGNTSFDNGVAGEFFDRNIVIEGGTLRVSSNYTYYRPGRRGGENHFGYGAGCERVEASGNYWAHRQSDPASLGRCDGEFSKNTLIGAVDDKFLARYPDNVHSQNAPKGLHTFVVKNRYDPTRSHIVVFNWDRHQAVNVDVTNAMLAPGASYELRDAMNVFADPVSAGVYEGGRLNIPMNRLTEAALTGHLASVLGHTAPEFGVFILITKPAATASTANSPPAAR